MTKPEPSPSAEAAPAPAPAPAPDPAAEAAAALEAARAVTPTEAGAYGLKLEAEALTALGLSAEGGAADPLVKGIQEHFLKAGHSQGRFDDFMATAGELARAGLFGDGGFDPAAELVKLGENGEARRREVEILADALVARKDGFTEEMRGELMSLSPTAAGVQLVEYLRKAAGDGLKIDPPAADGGGDPKAQALAMARDPRYRTDPRFRAEADKAWQAAHPRGR